MNYEELLLMIEGLPHTIKVPLRKIIRYAQKEHELLGLTLDFIHSYIDQEWSCDVLDKIYKKEKELEEMK